MKLILENWNKFVNEVEAEEPQELDAAAIVKLAFQKTDPSYLQKTLETRNSGTDAAGSTFASPTTAEALMSAEWQSYRHENLHDNVIGFSAKIPGILGIAKVSDLKSDARVRIQPSHGGENFVKNPKHPKAGQQVAELVTSYKKNLGDRDDKVDFTALILGHKDGIHNKTVDEKGKVIDPSSLVIYTFHPGAPTPPLDLITMPDVAKKFAKEGSAITTAAVAKTMGFYFVKNVDDL